MFHLSFPWRVAPARFVGFEKTYLFDPGFSICTIGYAQFKFVSSNFPSAREIAWPNRDALKDLLEACVVLIVHKYPFRNPSKPDSSVGTGAFWPDGLLAVPQLWLHPCFFLLPRVICPFNDGTCRTIMSLKISSRSFIRTLTMRAS